MQSSFFGLTFYLGLNLHRVHRIPPMNSRIEDLSWIYNQRIIEYYFTQTLKEDDIVGRQYDLIKDEDQFFATYVKCFKGCWVHIPWSANIVCCKCEQPRKRFEMSALVGEVMRYYCSACAHRNITTTTVREKEKCLFCRGPNPFLKRGVTISFDRADSPSSVKYFVPLCSSCSRSSTSLECYHCGFSSLGDRDKTLVKQKHLFHVKGEKMTYCSQKCEELAHNGKPFLLLSLPIDVLNMIYEYLLACSGLNDGILSLSSTCQRLRKLYQKNYSHRTRLSYSGRDVGQIFANVIKYPDLEYLRFLHSKGYKIFTRKIFLASLHQGRISIVEYLLLNQPLLMHGDLVKAVKNRNLEMAQFLWSHAVSHSSFSPPEKYNILSRKPGRIRDCLYYAAKNRDYQMLKWLLELPRFAMFALRDENANYLLIRILSEDQKCPSEILMLIDLLKYYGEIISSNPHQVERERW